MNAILSYLDTRPKANATVPQRCVRALTLLAGYWGAVAVVLMSSPLFVALQEQTISRVHILGECAFMIMLALYSVSIALHYIVSHPD